MFENLTYKKRHWNIRCIIAHTKCQTMRLVTSEGILSTNFSITSGELFGIGCNNGKCKTNFKCKCSIDIVKYCTCLICTCYIHLCTVTILDIFNFLTKLHHDKENWKPQTVILTAISSLTFEPEKNRWLLPSIKSSQ